MYIYVWREHGWHECNEWNIYIYLKTMKRPPDLVTQLRPVTRWRNLCGCVCFLSHWILIIPSRMVSIRHEVGFPLFRFSLISIHCCQVYSLFSKEYK
jgi:hypothetical protein